MKTTSSNVSQGQPIRLVIVPIGALSLAPDGQTRQNFDPATLQTLAASLRRSGVRSPILVAPNASAPDRYRVVAGERRWRAAQLAGLTEMPCLVDERLSDRNQCLLAQAEENLHREDLNVIEEAAVLVQLMDAFRLGAQEAGALIGRSYQQARRLLQIHNAPQPIRDAVVQGHIDARAALELVRICNKLAKDPAPDGKGATAKLEELIDRVVNERWTIRRLEHYARRVLDGAEEGSLPAPARGGRLVTASAGPSMSSPRVASATVASPPLFRRDENGVFIDTGRIARRQVSPEEREELIKILEELIMAVRRV